MRAFGILLLLVLLGGCADRATIDVGAPPSTSRAPDTLILQVRTGGGLMPTTGRVTELPQVSIYGDGRVITPGPTPAIFPGPALPGLQVARISAGQVDNLVAAGLKAGVGTLADLGQPEVADAPSTTFYVTGRTTEVDALGIGDDGTLTKAQRDGRKALQGLLDMLGALPKGSTPYVPVRLAAVSTPYTAPAGGVPALVPPAVAWPGPQLPGALTQTYGCVVTDGDQATAVLAAAAKANSATPWTSAGTEWRIAFRPLLPSESSCADLGR